jgi:hypothetical protein
MEQTFVYQVLTPADVICGIDHIGHYKLASMHPRATVAADIQTRGAFALRRVRKCRSRAAAIRLSKRSLCALLYFSGWRHMMLCDSDRLVL